MASILISGGTGLVGKHLCKILKEKGHSVAILSRATSDNKSIFHWNIKDEYIAPEAIKETDFIIHLAGAGIADKRWTKNRKIDLIDSRVASTNLLFKKVKELNPNLKGFISASGIGYYGAVTTSKTFAETDSSGNDFVSEICKLWENSVNQFNTLQIRTVILRTGIVLSKKGGALEKISNPIKLGFGANLGTGKQYIPWIHIEDLCNLFIEAIENNNLNGIYNAVSHEHCTNKTFTKTIAEILNKPLWLPNIPSAILKFILGEMAVILLEGSKISSKKIELTGFKFEFPTLKKALTDLLK
jgi:uncharacterized protein (TIGR01777 family)